MKNLTTDVLQALDNLVVHPWEDFGGIGEHKRLIVDHCEGIYLHDSDGNRFIDGPGGMWCVNVGHGRQEIADAMAEQAMTVCYSSPWSSGTSVSSLLAEKLQEISPGDLNHVFYATGGSSAVDAALRFVFFYNNALGRPEKKQIISRIGAYHGSTFLAATCSGKMSEKTNMDMANGIVHHIDIPKPLLRPDGMSLDDFCDEKVADLERIILELGADHVAAFIAEPILASGGVVIPPPGYHAKCLEVCRRHDVLYISDEVVTAFGRLGSWFASQDVFDIVPDIITSAKGLTSGYAAMGATLISDRLVEEIKQSNTDSKYFCNGFTYSGHPVSVVAALKNIEIIERENILGHVRELAPYFEQKLSALNELPVVAEVRAIGLMAGVECSLDPKNPDEQRDIEFANAVDKHCHRLGLLVRPVYNMCVMSPPLIITREEIDTLSSILHQGIMAASADFGIGTV